MSMGQLIEHIEIVCFAASYAVALLLEMARLWFRGRRRNRVGLGFVVAGLIAQTLYMISRTVHGGATPLSSSFDWYLVAAWVLVAFYLYIIWQHPTFSIDIFVLPLVLVLIAVAAFLTDREPFPTERASLWWGVFHGAFLLAGTVAVFVGALSGSMYLVQANRMKHKKPPLRGLQLPSLEWLQRINSRAIILSMFMLTVGLLSGSILNLVNHGGNMTTVPWSDPVVWSSAITLLWLAIAFVFATLYKPARQGRKVAYLTMTSCAFLIFSLAVGLFFTEHRKPPATKSSHLFEHITAPRHRAEVRFPTLDARVAMLDIRERHPVGADSHFRGTPPVPPTNQRAIASGEWR